MTRSLTSTGLQAFVRCGYSRSRGGKDEIVIARREGDNGIIRSSRISAIGALLWAPRLISIKAISKFQFSRGLQSFGELTIGSDDGVTFRLEIELQLHGDQRFVFDEKKCGELAAAGILAAANGPRGFGTIGYGACPPSARALKVRPGNQIESPRERNSSPRRRRIRRGATDDGKPGSVADGFGTVRPSAFPPREADLAPSAVTMRDQLTEYLPPGADNAPCLTALVTSSCRTRAIDCPNFDVNRTRSPPTTMSLSVANGRRGGPPDEFMQVDARPTALPQEVVRRRHGVNPRSSAAADEVDRHGIRTRKPGDRRDVARMFFTR